jgi:hypothetical protein
MELATSVAADLDCSALNGEVPASPSKKTEPVALGQETEDETVKDKSEVSAADLGKPTTAGKFSFRFCCGFCSKLHFF